MQNQISTFIINISLLLLSLLQTLIVAEYALRILIPMDTGGSYWSRIPHPVRGWTLIKDADYYHEMTDTTVHVTINSAGWRDVEHQIEKPDGVFRILILGDSYMEAYSVELEDSFTRQLEKLTRASGVEVEVINLGVSGYGTLQEYLTFQEVGQYYAPDLVLLGFYFQNDLRNNSLELSSMLGMERFRGKTRPFLDASVIDQWNITQVDYEGAQTTYAEVSRRKSTLSAKIRRTFLWELSKRAKKGILQSKKRPRNHQEQNDLDYGQQQLAQLGPNYCSEPDEVTRAWNTTQRILLKLKKNVDALGTKLLVFTVPAKLEVETDQMQKVMASAENPAALCIEEAKSYARLERILSKMDIGFIGLLTDFRRENRVNGKALFHHGSDRHWNSEGHKLAAEQVLSELIKMQLFPIDVE